jgi:integrase
MDLAGEFIEWCHDAGRSPVTIHNWRRVLTRYCETVDPLTASADDIRAYLSRWNDAPANTRHAYRVALAAFYRWALDAELLDIDPMRKVPPAPATKGAPRPISSEQFAAVLADAPPTMRAWLLLGGDAGLRRAEIARTTPESIMGRRLHVHGKGSRQRVVPMSLRLADALQRAGPWDVTPRQVGQRVSWFMRRCGVDATCHQLRHLAATRYYQASGHDLRATQAFLGHASSATTEIYVAFADQGLDIVDRMAA